MLRPIFLFSSDSFVLISLCCFHGARGKDIDILEGFKCLIIAGQKAGSESQELDWPGLWCYGLDQNKCMVLSTPV